MDVATIVAFSGVAALLTITPGVDMALVTSSALARGRRAALSTTLGIVSGLLAWGAVSALGIAALLAASATAFTVLKLAGAAYLVILGVRTLWSARSGGREPERPRHEPDRRSAFRQGLVSNLLNPKIAVFYSTLLPQFLEPGDPVLAGSLLLTAIHAAMSLAWLTGYGALVAGAGDRLRRPAVRRALDAVTGSVLVALGVRLAFERR